MDSYQISLIAIPPICAFIGFLGKYVVDKRTQYLQNINSKKLDIVESKLKKFYYPVHSNLLRENIIWNKVLNFYLSRNDVDTEFEFIHNIHTASMPQVLYLTKISKYEEHSKLDIDINNTLNLTSIDTIEDPALLSYLGDMYYTDKIVKHDFL